MRQLSVEKHTSSPTHKATRPAVLIETASIKQNRQFLMKLLKELGQESQVEIV